MDVNSVPQMDFFWGIYNGTQLGDLEGVLVRNPRWTLAG